MHNQQVNFYLEKIIYAQTGLVQEIKKGPGVLVPLIGFGPSK